MDNATDRKLAELLATAGFDENPFAISHSLTLFLANRPVHARLDSEQGTLKLSANLGDCESGNLPTPDECLEFNGIGYLSDRVWLGIAGGDLFLHGVVHVDDGAEKDDLKYGLERFQRILETVAEAAGQTDPPDFGTGGIPMGGIRV